MAKYKQIWEKSSFLKDLELLIKGEIHEIKLSSEEFKEIGIRQVSGHNFKVEYQNRFKGSSAQMVGRDLADVLNENFSIKRLSKGRHFILRMKNFVLTIENMDGITAPVYQSEDSKIQTTEPTNDEHRVHSFEAIVGDEPRYLVLGSAPSRESLARNQYYAKKGNRFWMVLGDLFHEDLSSASYEEKIAFLKRNHVALWDTLKSCDRADSMDSSIKNELPNDIDGFLKGHPSIQRVIFNGKKAAKHYIPNIPSATAFSTSPANCQFNRDRMLESWKEAFDI